MRMPSRIYVEECWKRPLLHPMGLKPSNAGDPSSGVISLEFDKAEAIKSMEPPKTIKEVPSHLGLFQFFSELIEDYALVAAPLGAVTSPSHPWRGEKLSGPLPEEALRAWNKLIKIISSRPAIAFPDFSLPFQLHVDASVGQEHHGIRGGLGAILTQVQDRLFQQTIPRIRMQI